MKNHEVTLEQAFESVNNRFGELIHSLRSMGLEVSVDISIRAPRGSMKMIKAPSGLVKMIDDAIEEEKKEPSKLKRTPIE